MTCRHNEVGKTAEVGLVENLINFVVTTDSYSCSSHWTLFFDYTNTIDP
jgi:hypothetical protein